MAGLENRGKDKGSSGWPSCASSDEIEATWLIHFKKINIWHSAMLVEMIQILVVDIRDLFWMIFVNFI